MKIVIGVLLPLLLLCGSSFATIVTPEVVLVDPTADLQMAVDNLDATLGGEIHLGPGTYTLDSPLILDRPVKLYGAGRYATYLYCADADSDIVRVTSSGVTIRDLTIYGPASAGTGIGLELRAPVGGYIRDFDANNLTIHSTGSWCTAIFGPGWMDTTLAGGYSGTPISPTFNRVTFWNNQSGGTLYAGHGVAAPRFNDCNFTGQGYTTGPANDGTVADSLLAWHWGSVLPAWHNVTDSLVLHRGHVYLCVSSDAVFSGCVFQNLTTGNNDEPLISIEDCIGTRFLNSYFEVYDSTRAQPMVTMSAAQGFSFDGVYVRSAYAAPFHFLRTNSNGSSICYGSIHNFWGRQGDNIQKISANERMNDFVVNTSGDGSLGYPLIISNTTISCEDGTSYDRPVDVRTFSGYTILDNQSVLLQNTSRRFRFPPVSKDTLWAMTNPKAGEALFCNADTTYIGSRGALMVGTAGHVFYAGRIPFTPVFVDTAARESNYPSPSQGDRCYIRNYYSQNRGVEMVFDGMEWKHSW